MEREFLFNIYKETITGIRIENLGLTTEEIAVQEVERLNMFESDETGFKYGYEEI